jgi:hypothetical protein
MTASGRRLIIFRNRLRPGVAAAYGPRAGEVYALAEKMPGFLGRARRGFCADCGTQLTSSSRSDPAAAHFFLNSASSLFSAAPLSTISTLPSRIWK